MDARPLTSSSGSQATVMDQTRKRRKEREEGQQLGRCQEEDETSKAESVEDRSRLTDRHTPSCLFGVIPDSQAVMRIRSAPPRLSAGVGRRTLAGTQTPSHPISPPTPHSAPRPSQTRRGLHRIACYVYRLPLSGCLPCIRSGGSLPSNVS